MKNFYQALDLPLDADPQNLIQRLEKLQQDHPKLVEESTAILLSPSRRADYNLVHAQYQVITHVYYSLEHEGILDTNNWSGRLADFNTPKLQGPGF